ncbi:MAG TPA: peptidylprolyl isomerase [Terracidiphilus sp.]|jgi:peptidyl-prolyl cis-trans isomerase D
MIRFLQAKDSRIVKAIFVIIIAVVSVGMVLYLIPGFTGMGSSAADTYAIIYPHWYSRIFSSGVIVSQEHVATVARRQAQQNPQYLESPGIMRMIEQQAGQQEVRDQILLIEADKLGITASSEDVARFLHQGQYGEVLYPNGQFIGTESYTAIVTGRLNMSVPEFEQNIQQGIIIIRLRSLITAGVTVSDADVREAYRQQNITIKFDYAVISADDLRKTINPSDSDLEAFFKKNAARYASAVPEQRKITYFAFTPNELPGGTPQPTQQEIQQYFNAHLSEYSVPEQARSRHILIKVAPGADARTDAAAKAKADALLKQIKSGANFADLARKNSEDSSKEMGGELGFFRRGATVPEFEKALFNQKIGDTEIVKSQFGYHILQVEERQPEHHQSLDEVRPAIVATLVRLKATAAEENYARALTSEAIKNGLEKTAAAHHLVVTTTPLVGAQGVISAFVDSTQILGKAFQSRQGDPPQFTPTGEEAYAIFQVTEIAPAHAPAFADWKKNVLKDFQDQQLPVLLGQKTQELAEKAKNLNDLSKAAKAVGATLKTSDLVGPSDQVPEFGMVAQVAPQLFDLKPGELSGPISAGRTGVVARLVDKKEPPPDEIARNFDQTRDQLLGQRQNEAFNLFLSTIMSDYKKHNRIRIPRAKGEQPGL